MNETPVIHSPLLFGEVLFDCFADGSRILGGAPFNVAWHLQGFGAQPILFSRVGDDPLGHQIRHTMIDWGMSTVGLQLDSRYPTGEVRVSLDNGQPAYDIVLDRAWDHIEPDALPPLQPRLIYHGSLGLRGTDSASSFAQLCVEYSAPRYFDVNLRPPHWQPEQIRELIGQCRWLKINDDELSSLVPKATSLEAKAEELMARQQIESILVTQGAAGAFLLDDHGTVTRVAPETEVKVVDTVGAGDAFAAVTLLGIMHGWSGTLTLQRAQQFASVIVGQRGATAFNRDLYQCQRQVWGI